MKTIHLFLAAVLSFGALQAHARSAVPIVNHQDVVVTRGSGQPASAADVRKAIVAAAAARKWVVSEPRRGVLIATYSARGHSVTTEISYSAGKFSVVYKDSSNMKYRADGGTGEIHPFYNTWVENLVRDTQLELSRT